jgi:thiamine biosynthesis protein ThiS
MPEATSAIQIVLNGEPRQIADGAGLIGLIAQLNLRKGRIAVEINRVIVPKAEWPAVVLKSGDSVEIVNFVGGG